ncbi:hypothetical protein CEXT_269391 [Caerostris extrusa]|uniref:Uncharacterized protein n=1 Tax=Caerostris extrusa TaxID=172846 RepID=A0AAV4S9W4_CAEEX|nr:hypothetical protein CEXT_269391 [Caerostris extrusa]
MSQTDSKATFLMESSCLFWSAVRILWFRGRENARKKAFHFSEIALFFGDRRLPAQNGFPPPAQNASVLVKTGDVRLPALYKVRLHARNEVKRSIPQKHKWKQNRSLLCIYV